MNKYKYLKAAAIVLLAVWAFSKFVDGRLLFTGDVRLLFTGIFLFAIIGAAVALVAWYNSRREPAKPADKSDSLYVRYPVAFHTVDMAVTRKTEADPEEELLLIQKAGESSWRFPGGFVDPADESAELAARRECVEETGGMELGWPQYIGSRRIDDPRYRNSPHKIITSFYELQYMWGKEQAGDDAKACRWFKLRELADRPELRNPIHEELFVMFFAKKGIVYSTAKSTTNGK
jgi:ADP-ribose pyrophosphatase YjhB (NUDIX family)